MDLVEEGDTGPKDRKRVPRNTRSACPRLTSSWREETIMITNQELAWMAGIVDLKGRITYKRPKSRSTPQITLTVNSTMIPVVERMCRLTGTTPEIHTMRPLSETIRRGCIEHCPEQHIHVSVDGLSPYALKWTVSGSSLLVVVHNLRPYLVIDQGYGPAEDEIKSALPLSGRGAQAILTSCNRLRSLGWQLPEFLEHALDKHLTRALAATEDEDHDGGTDS